MTFLRAIILNLDNSHPFVLENISHLCEIGTISDNGSYTSSAINTLCNEPCCFGRWYSLLALEYPYVRHVPRA